MMRTRLYIILLAACGAGYCWLCYLSFINPSFHEADGTVCIIKNVTGIPCPSCGSTRSVFSLLHGNIAGALLWNPLGILMAIALLAAPLWIAFDWILKKETLFLCYVKGEQLLQRRWVAAPAIMVVLLNWIWNIHKGL